MVVVVTTLDEDVTIGERQSGGDGSDEAKEFCLRKINQNMKNKHENKGAWRAVCAGDDDGKTEHN